MCENAQLSVDFENISPLVHKSGPGQDYVKNKTICLGRNRDTDVENKCMDTKGVKWPGERVEG